MAMTTPGRRSGRDSSTSRAIVAASRRPSRRVRPRHRPGRHHRRRGQLDRRGLRGRRRTHRLPGLARHPHPRTGQDPAAGEHADPGTGGRDRGGGVTRRRQAHHPVPGRRRQHRGRDVRVLRGVSAHTAKAPTGASRSPRTPTPAGAARRGRGHHAVQLPAHPERHEARPGTRRRQRRGAQAGRGHTAVGAADGRPADRGRRAGRGGQRRHRPGFGRRERHCCGTPASTRSPSPARPPSAGTPPRSPASTSSRSPWSWAGTPHRSCSTTPTSGGPIDAAIKAFVFNTGQFCMAGPRLLVARPLYEPVLEVARPGRAAHPGRRPVRRGHGHRPDGGVPASREGRGLRAARPRGGRPHRRRRRAAPRRRVLPPADGHRGPRRRLPRRAGGGLRPRADRAAVRHRGRGRRAGQQHGVRAGGRPAHPRRGPRAPGRRTARRRDRVGQRLGHARPGDAVRRREAVRVRPRERSGGALPPTPAPSP